jgi:NAD(P)-dependent dehydrogenase (short-subunit alcohol dehydrogenase family)
MIGKVPSRRIGVLKDIADAAIYLGSDLGKYVNGSILTVDGGTELGDASLDCLTIPNR